MCCMVFPLADIGLPAKSVQRSLPGVDVTTLRSERIRPASRSPCFLKYSPLLLAWITLCCVVLTSSEHQLAYASSPHFPPKKEMPATPLISDARKATDSMRTNSLMRSRVFVFLLLVAFCAVWFYVLQARTLVPTDEGRYAEIAREMAASGDFVTPRLNGTKYFEKPPLQAWITALTFKAFGLGEWQARLWTGLCGLFGIALVAYTGRRVFNARTGAYAAMILASSAFWSLAGHVNSLDMGLAAMMSLALCAFLLAQRDQVTPNERRNWMWLCWAGMALAVMSKGLPGVVLPGAVLVLYALLQKDFSLWRRLHLVSGALIFLAITVPWFVLVSIRNPEFPQFFFVHEHFQRFASNVHRREGAWYYFIPLLIGGILPWLGMLPQSLRHGWRKEAGVFQPMRMLLVWSIFIFVFFSLSGSKLPAYILPVFPALALLIARYLDHASHKPIVITAGLLSLCCASVLAFVAKTPTLAHNSYELPLYQQHMPWIATAAACGLAGGLFAVWMARRQREWALLALAVCGFVGVQLVLIGHEPLGRYKAGVAHVPAIQAELGPHTPLYAVGLYEQVLPFYLQRTLTLVENPDEMAPGLEQEPHLWLPTRETFIARWIADRNAGNKALAIMRLDIYADLKNRAIPMRVVAQDPRRIIVSNAPQ
jgi:4-amino-4-deoxy-L-arabinose transferase-like glycosyltransferase